MAMSPVVTERLVRALVLSAAVGAASRREVVEPCRIPTLKQAKSVLYVEKCGL